MQLSKSNKSALNPYNGGPEEARTPDPLNANQVLFQLSYRPDILVGPSGFEPLTPVLSGLCSNQLSYGPIRLTVHQYEQN